MSLYCLLEFASDFEIIMRKSLKTREQAKKEAKYEAEEAERKKLKRLKKSQQL